MSVVHYYILCWNEERILPQVLDHYSKFCQKMVVMDNESDDRSVEIIQSYPNAEVRTYQSNSQIRNDIYLEIKNNIWKESRGKADWVIVCDTDEVLFHPDIVNKLDELKEKGYSIVKPIGYDMISETFPDNIFDVKMGVRDTRHLSKCILFNPDLIEEINFQAGCHKCYPTGKIKMYNEEDIKLLHFKMLGLDYVLARLNQVRGRTSQQDLDNNWGKHRLWTEQKHADIFIKKRKVAKLVPFNSSRDSRFIKLVKQFLGID